jgi:hypothetical protein
MINTGPSFDSHPMGSSSLRGLEPRARRRLVLRAIARVTFTLVGLLVFYSVAPLRANARLDTVVHFVIGLAILCAVVAFQVRAILNAKHPEIRAAESIVTAIGLFIVASALTDLGLSMHEPHSFTERLDRITAMYFVITVVATVGFGDIAAKTDPARLVVTVQMLLNLTLIVVIARVFIGLARHSVSDRQQAPQPPGGAGP